MCSRLVGESCRMECLNEETVTSATRVEAGSGKSYTLRMGNPLTKTSPSLRGEDSSHKTTTRSRSRELGRDDGAERVVSSNTYAHNETKHCEDTNDVDRRPTSRQCLCKCAGDDNHQLNPVCQRRLNQMSLRRIIFAVRTYTSACDQQRLRATRREFGQSDYQSGMPL